MKLLKREREEVAALLAQGAASPEELADLVAAKLDEVRGERIVQFALARVAGIVTVAGMYSTTNQARKALEKAPADAAWVVPGRTAEGWQAHLEAVDKPAEPKGDFEVVREDALLFKRGWDGKQSTRGGW